MFSRLFLLLLAIVQMACNSTPALLSAQHPASPSAPGGSQLTPQTTLRPDAATVRTRQLLAMRDQQARAAAAEAVSPPAAREPSEQRVAPSSQPAAEEHEHP